jgi:hypothetical protein
VDVVFHETFEIVLRPDVLNGCSGRNPCPVCEGGRLVGFDEGQQDLLRKAFDAITHGIRERRIITDNLLQHRRELFDALSKRFHFVDVLRCFLM